jgi:hypothetical protein
MYLRYGINPHQAGRVAAASVPGPVKVRSGEPSKPPAPNSGSPWSAPGSGCSAISSDRPARHTGRDLPGIRTASHTVTTAS